MAQQVESPVACTEPLAEIDLILAQADQFGHAQAMAVGDNQDQCGVSCPAAAPLFARSQ